MEALTQQFPGLQLPRTILTDELWSKLKPILLEHDIHDKPTLRRTVEGILYRLRVGCPWRDLPAAFGPWNTVYKRYNHWSSKSIFIHVLNVLSKDTDTEWVFMDGSYIKAHQHGTGAAGVAIPARYIWPWMPMACHCVLRSPAATSTTVRQPLC